MRVSLEGTTQAIIVSTAIFHNIALFDEREEILTVNQDLMNNHNIINYANADPIVSNNHGRNYFTRRSLTYNYFAHIL